MLAGSGTLSRKESATDDTRPRHFLHNADESLRDSTYIEPAEEDDSTRRPSRNELEPADQAGGTWGERDVGGPVNTTMAMEDYEVLRRELTNLSAKRSRSSLKEKRSKGSLREKQSRTSLRDNALTKTISGRSGRSHRTPIRTRTQATEKSEDEEIDAGDEDVEDFPLDEFMREGHFEKRTDGRSAKKVGVVFKDLTVKGIGISATFVKTLPDAVLGSFGPDLYRLLCRFFPFLAFGGMGPTRVLINNFTGLVKDGEMMLVLGRPGAGCSTFLKALANSRESFVEVSGEVSYGGIDAAKQKKQYRGEINYNPEDDVHMANLNVWQTFVFALLNKTKKRDKNEIPIIVNALMKMFGIPHTKYTKVGNEYVRGISGGERKRVSIAETLATKSTVLCWDNSTRGLDASTALDYARSLRIMTDVSNKATITTLYQAGEGIYDVMDKVLVIDQGRCIFEGPAKDAKQYFINLGFYCPERQTTADFLTACTDTTERRFRAGCEKSTPKSPQELEKAFLESEAHKRVLAEVDQYERSLRETDFADAKAFEQTVQEGKSNKTVSKKSSYTVSFPRQVLACARREFWLLWGDTTTLYTKISIIISNGLIVGSLFYGQPLGTSGAFSRGGSMFFGILFLGWLQLTELMKAVTGRAVVARQHDYAFYRPSAVVIARVLVDLPVILPQVLLFSIIMYFMCNLDVVASKFWIYTLFVFVTTITLTALYRMFASMSAAIDDAVRFSGIALNLLIIYTGYVIPKPQLLQDYIWFGWLTWVNPLAYSFEAVLTNEFADRNLDCDPSTLVPQGPGVDPAHQGCSLTGSPVDAQSVPGSQYLNTTYTYERSHLWRNFGVLIAYTVLYILVTMIAVETFNFAKGGGGALIFKKSKQAKKAVKIASPDDEEKARDAGDSSASSGRTETSGAVNEKALQQLSSSQSVLTWQNVNYSIPYQGGQKRLLHDVTGYAKPGVMVALMGASGAGKTTLLNTLAQRQYMGVVSGDMVVDGRPLGPTFQRSTGFCEQMDLHDGTATIREALEFSAVLRQDRELPRQEKIAYVDTVIDLLELREIQDAVINSLGVEQRKRLTIGVELAAKPSLLLFLDEPTSGLDSQSAYSIIRFLRKLSAAGQAIICTIHQPSSVLIQQFDMILALNPGGNTFYFGPVGDEGSAVIKYFGERGFQCPPQKNIAEFILEIAAKTRRRADGSRVNWNEEWRRSDEAKRVDEEIEAIKNERCRLPEPEKGSQHAFAAPIWTQTGMLTQRLFRQYWRDPSYLYGKLFSAVIVAIFNGFTFYALGNTTTDMQNRMFSAFLILTIPPTVVNTVVPKFFTNMMLWQARELPSRIYGWVAFTTAQVVCEIPISIVSSVLYFLLWYFPAGLPTESSVSGYVFLMTMLFFLFMASWGQWITAFAPSFTVIANVLPFFFVMFSLFNGVVRPYSQLPVFWKYWMYYVNPSTWWIGGVLSATLHNIPVDCTPSETAQFTPPPGQTCQQYAGAFAQQAGGYLLAATRDSTSLCQYCPYSTGDDYLSTLNISPGDKWRDFGVFLVFVCSNYALVYFFIWTVRIKGWSFGLGLVFSFLGKVADAILKPFKKLAARNNKE
ncbi:MAG: hypothetical protein M1828_001802 [Chrysothrix sp. TS-e1954]|nr:MAG: hypothetical protein M1828_001802 [Chrysothrix sp. TS-e1954]